MDLVNRDVREGKLRSNGSEWQESWKVYVREVMEESKRWQITEGGPIIGLSDLFCANFVNIPTDEATFTCMS